MFIQFCLHDGKGGGGMLKVFHLHYVAYVLIPCPLFWSSKMCRWLALISMSSLIVMVALRTAHKPHLEESLLLLRVLVKEYVVPLCLVLVIDENLYGLMVALSYI